MVRGFDFEPVSFGASGLGGYAWVVAQTIAERPDVASLIGVCEPDDQRRAERADILRQWGVTAYEDFDQLLKEPIEAVWLPLPINLHGQFTARRSVPAKQFCARSRRRQPRRKWTR